jgi:quercetin dioxygenase-like cupin family protein
MEISRSAATAKGPAETFTGDVWVDPLTRGLPPSQLNVAGVRFAPGARSAWHSHDGGQTLHVTEGRALVQPPESLGDRARLNGPERQRRRTRR